jgi:small subunit ribosomal protein S6
MHNYELVTVISPEVDDERIAKLVDKMSQFISAKEGVVENMEQWGKRKLAYPIKRFMEANYILTRFRLEPGSIRELEAELTGSEEVLRYLVVKVGN